MASNKALQATADEVTLGQIGTCLGLIKEANFEAINLSTFKVKAIIKLALSLVGEARAALDDLELGHNV